MTGKQRLRAMLDAIPEPCVLLEPVRTDDGSITDFVFADANRASGDYYGYEPRDLIGRSLTDVNGENLRADQFARFVHCVTTGTPFTLEMFEYVDPMMGENRWFDIHGSRVGSDLFCKWVDVTDRHRAGIRVRAVEDAHRILLETSETLRAEMEALLDQGSTIAIRWSQDGTMQQVSGSVMNVLGRSPTEYLGRNVEELATDGSPEGAIVLRSDSRTDGPGKFVQILARHVSGALRVLEGVMIPSGHTDHSESSALLTDVTERDAAERMRVLMSAVAGHELRTPLAFLRLGLGMLELGTISCADTEGRELIARMITSVESITRMADRLLSLERLERPDVAMNLILDEPVDVAGCVRDAVAIVAALHPNPIKIHDHSGGQTLTVDRILVTQAVENLLTNAIRHGADDGPIDVTVTAEKQHVIISVRDRGPGIPAAVRDLIFDPFFRPAGNRVENGSGLGLAIVRRIALVHHGRAWIEDPHDGPGVIVSFSVQAIETAD